MTRAVIHGVGHAVPDKVLSNADLEKMVDTNDEWIKQRTGIAERRVCGPDDSCTSLAVTAAQRALAAAGTSAEEVEMIVVGTVTGDFPFPSCSCLVQDHLGATNAGAFDVGAACAGFIYSVASVAPMLETGKIRTALVIGVDVLSKYVDYSDRSTCVLFGDGAGAVVLKAEEATDRGVIDTVLLSDGSGAKHIKMEYGGTANPPHQGLPEGMNPFLFMAGAEVYRFAVGAMGDACERVLERTGLRASDIDLFVPHQANLRIIESAAKRLDLADDKVFINVQNYGNTSGGSIPIALSEASAQGRLKKGDLVMTVGFGAGLVWGANLIRW
ncbi:MAG: ketoacyl-ACP synthase III [Chthonomonas sp.]|nr:ketoacyl-ACP synthase III [Chthonomonas sp.]